MAKGKKTGGRNFVKGVVTNPSGRPPIPSDLKEARETRRTELESIIYKYLDCSLAEIGEHTKNPDTPIKDLIILKFMEKALKDADIQRYNLLLERTIGKVPDQLNVKGQIQTQNLHATIMADLKDFRDKNGSDGT